MSKIQDFFKGLTGSETPVVKVGIDTNTLINIYLTLTLSAATILLMYFFINKNK